MGVDVEQLFTQHTKKGLVVTFTFVGPVGLIEGGSNQSFALQIDTEGLQSVDQIKDMLMQELEMDKGIELVLKTKLGKQISNLL